jgi:hypothetical protein
MRTTMIAALAAVSLTAIAAPTVAQQNQPGFTPQQLDQMSKERQQAIGPRNWGPPPPQSSIPKEHLQQPSKLLVCMTTDAWKPIYGEPSASAPVIGKTLTEVAVEGRAVNGFVPILYGPGRTGYLPAQAVRPFHSDLNAGATCTISGVRPNGAAVFDIH